MAHKKTSDQISYNMSRIKNKNTAIELQFEEELKKRGFSTYVKNPKGIPGKPDFAFPARKIAVFCDGDFWHGYNWEETKITIHSHQDFWIPKIEKNIARDNLVNETLENSGWTVLRFWGNDIKKNLQACADKIERTVKSKND